MRLAALILGAMMVTALPGSADARSRPAGDPELAVHEELCAARKKGTAAAYDLFIARHPKHALAKKAREERARLTAARK